MAKCSGHHAEFGRAGAGAGRHTNLSRSPARENDACRSAVYRCDVDAEKVHARRTDEGGDKFVRRLVVKLERRADLRNDSVVENDDLVGQSHRLRLVMRHIDHRRAKIGVELRQLEAHLHAQFRIEVRQRLVEQENLGLAHQRPADRHSLTLTAGKLGRAAIEMEFELQDARDFLRSLVLNLFSTGLRRRERRRYSATRSYAERAHRTGTPRRCAASLVECRLRLRCR